MPGLYDGKGYGQFKNDVAEVIVESIRPIQESYEDIVKSVYLDDVLTEGASRASKKAAKTLHKVEFAMGLARC
ncbi:hypothetical protein ABRT01_15835 [Lentibacillus sp. L22]|uniref:hypothetical protein n=1 Tax=Lentibacillus sp. L22 TaxID=3163028 RepID=UPI003467A746